MKRLIMAVVLCLMIAPSLWAKDITVEITQGQDVVSHPDFKGWELWSAVDIPGGEGPYQHFVDIPYRGQSGPPYTSAETLELLWGEHVYHFVLITLLGEGRSKYSNSVNLVLTKEIPAATIRVVIPVQ